MHSVRISAQTSTTSDGGGRVGNLLLKLFLGLGFFKNQERQKSKF